MTPADSILSVIQRIGIMGSPVIVAVVFAAIVCAPPAWATPFSLFDRAYSHEVRAGEDFLYASLPDPNVCIAGTLTQKAKDRALESMNRIRALHGLAKVRYSSRYDRSVQEAALIQAANGYPGHYPKPSARCYTAAGAEASRTSNLYSGGGGVDPVVHMIGWTNDARNRSMVAAAGHRRWILNPFATYMSYGQVEGYAAQKVFGFDRESKFLPPITVDHIAFPYETYPFTLMADDPPWSFSVVEDKKSLQGNRHPYFQLATVRVTRVSDGTRLRVSHLHNDGGEKNVLNFLSWRVAGWAFDTWYQVEIRNVAMQRRKLQSFSYRVYIDRAGRQPETAREARGQMRFERDREKPLPSVLPSRQRKITREAREREARAAARAAKRRGEYRKE